MSFEREKPESPLEDKSVAPIWHSPRLAFGILLLALILRLFLLSWPPFYTGIEELHVPSSFTYVETGHFNPDNDYSGPFRKILQYPSLKLLGDTSVARRLPGVIFGSLTVFFLVLLGQQLFPKSRIGAMAGLFLATDPFHISFSRTTWEDIPAALFLTAGFYCLAKAVSETKPDGYLKMLIWASAALALALATRRYVAIILLATVAWLVYREFKGPKLLRGSSLARRLAFILVLFGLLPLIIYALTFYPWFLRGYSLPEWFAFQKHMISIELTGISPELSGYGRFYGHSYRAFDWFTRPVVFGAQMPVGKTLTATSMIINNPLSWLLIWPALAALIWQWRQRRQSNLALALIVFALTYLPFLIAQRQILIYSALAVLPTAFLLLAAALEIIGPRIRKQQKSLSMLLAAVIIGSNLAFYPLAIAMPLPQAWADLVPFKSALMNSDANR